MKLSELKPGQSGKILAVHGEDVMSFRLAEMGVIEGETIKVTKKAPFGDPIEIEVMSYNLCLRKKQAQDFDIELVDVSLNMAYS